MNALPQSVSGSRRKQVIFPIDRLADRCLEFLRLMRIYGPPKASRIFWKLHSILRVKSAILPPGYVTSGPIFLRKDNSDAEVFSQVFIDEQYKHVWHEPGEPAIILDAGANVGISSLYFREQFPNARILALEPCESNYAQLKRNTEGIANITAIRGALWNKAEPVVIKNPGDVGAVLQVDSCLSNGVDPVPGFSMDDLMMTNQIERFDLVKIDIEGAERAVFSGDTAWLSKVRVLAIELHEHITPGCGEALFRALNPYRFQVHLSGESLVIRLLGLV